MEKNIKTKRNYTVTYSSSDYTAPCIKITGKWLKEKGFDIGNHLELIEGKNMLILIRKDELLIKEETVKYEISKLEKQLKQLKSEI